MLYFDYFIARKYMINKLILMLMSCILFLSGCVSIPSNVKPVDNFISQKYLGKWYEIARLENSFEKGLDKISAEYILEQDGGIKVINRGFSSKENNWKSAEGKAYFVDGTDKGFLKVSFFGPFYGSYIVFEIDDKNYQYSMVSGPNKSYLWILSRNTIIPDEIQKKLIQKAKSLGFDTDKLVYVKH
jgi:apolipoprotein D and lipocalin family protein